MNGELGAAAGAVTQYSRADVGSEAADSALSASSRQGNPPVACHQSIPPAYPPKSMPAESAEALAVWVSAAASGDSRAFSRLFRALHPELTRFVRRRLRVQADVEDVVAQSFHKILERLADYDAARCSVRGWALMIARSRVIDHLRGQRPGEDIGTLVDALPGGGQSPIEQLAADETLRRLHRQLADLPLRSRQVLALRLGDGLSHQEIAEVLELSVANVKQISSRALRSLRGAIDDQDKPAHCITEVDYAPG